MQYTPQDRACAEKARAERERNKPMMPRAYDPKEQRMAEGMAGLREALRNMKRPEPTNTGVRPSMGDPKYGFAVNLPQVSSPLPTAPAIVGGNVNWKTLTSSPATHFLHSKLSMMRPMVPRAPLGTLSGLAEPSLNSIHTTY
jgi:hypothetical protein